ncbi:hypothetical protein K435DRAFT_841597 [Dendrothele bispora CBS 962.96]|uniref:DUF6534 domain-containing protein n=1 Tax=Dendrothele bispora (strain CBS 962.96) TaxID=1314807 RepID=A0A4S8LLP1_DENBC|nr:hypothetical protein K435DRAFT_841597 [Dendrothele bispora CBS 962.96]
MSDQSTPASSHLPPFDLGPTLGALELGVLLATLLYGTVLVQLFNYFHSQFQDRPAIKRLVYFIALIETLDTSLLWTYLYSRTVHHFGDFEMLAQPYWALALIVPLGDLAISGVQLFFAYRVYKLTQKRFYPVLCILFSMLRLVKGSAIAITMATEGSTVTIPGYVVKFKPLVLVALALGAGMDVANTIALCMCFVRRNGEAQARTRRIIDKLILWTIETGLITSLCGVLELILMATTDSSDDLMWIFFFFQSPKLYSNALLASLNRRALLQSLGQNVSVNADSRLSSARRNVRIDVDIDHSGEPVLPSQSDLFNKGSDKISACGIELHTIPGSKNSHGSTEDRALSVV